MKYHHSYQCVHKLASRENKAKKKFKFKWDDDDETFIY